MVSKKAARAWPWSRAAWPLLMLTGLVALLVWSLLGDGILATLLSRSLSSTEKVNALRAFFHSLGLAAPLAYVALVTVEVVIAPLPGTMLYAPGGMIFGAFWGGLLSLIGNVIGAALACQLARSLGQAWVDRQAPASTLTRLQDRVTEHGVLVVFLLRVNPLTSSDLVSYAAGFTRLPIWKLCVGTALGMAPLCWIQSYAADRLLTNFPQLVYPLLALCAISCGLALSVLWKWTRDGDT